MSLDPSFRIYLKSSQKASKARGEFVDRRYYQFLTEVTVPRDPETMPPEQPAFKSREWETRRDLNPC